MYSMLKEVKYKVEDILREYPPSRDDDDLLYLEIIREYDESLLGTSVGHFFRNRKTLGIPTFETVRRSRQKIQAENPELKGKRAIEREEAEESYRAFARSDG